ncbi:MAG: hypothetical protein LBP35_02175 [Candidatus Ancillula trichonymphae]|nr:hypothetical protein [Candidatus Ancillula trichonymphae]
MSISWKTASEKKTHYAPYTYADYGYGKDFYGNYQVSKFSYVNKGVLLREADCQLEALFRSE